MFYFFNNRINNIYRRLCGFVLVCFISNTVIPPPFAYSQMVTQPLLGLPLPGTMVPTSPGFVPAHIKGVTIHPDNPLQFDFIIDTGDSRLKGEALSTEASRLVKYFLASLTVPENELWVNLSPYEKDRIVSDGLANTEMGRDMLAQDYLLKQLTASLMYPEEQLGEEFWQRVREKAKQMYGTANIPMNTFNKVWVTPDKAVVYEHENSAFVVSSHLKVMLEEEYKALALQNGLPGPLPALGGQQPATNIQTDIIREVLVPEIEKEINAGKNFAQLRQIYNSMILAMWYKRTLKESLLGQVYFNQNKTIGIDVEDKQIKEKIYQQYLKAFQKGVYDYIKDDYDAATQEVISRKYFSGGLAIDPGKIQILKSSDLGDQAMLVVSNIVKRASPDSEYLNAAVKLVDIGEASDEEAVNELAREAAVSGAHQEQPGAAVLEPQPMDEAMLAQAVKTVKTVLKVGVFASMVGANTLTGPEAKAAKISSVESDTASTQYFMTTEKMDTLSSVVYQFASHYGFDLPEEINLRDLAVDLSMDNPIKFESEKDKYRDEFYLEPNQGLNATRLFALLETIEMLNQSDILGVSRARLGGEIVNVYFVNSRHKDTFNFNAMNYRDNIAIFVNSLDEGTKVIMQIRDGEMPGYDYLDRGFYQKVLAGKSEEDLFWGRLRHRTAHELAHTVTTPIIDRGDFREQQKALLKFSSSFKGVPEFRILQEVSGNLADVIASPFPQFTFGEVNRYALDCPMDVYREAYSIIARGVLEKLEFRKFLAEGRWKNAPRFSDETDAVIQYRIDVLEGDDREIYSSTDYYFLRQSFIASLSDNAIRKAAREIFEENFGPFPEVEVKIPDEFVRAYREQFLTKEKGDLPVLPPFKPQYKPQAPDDAMLAEGVKKLKQGLMLAVIAGLLPSAGHAAHFRVESPADSSQEFFSDSESGDNARAIVLDAAKDLEIDVEEKEIDELIAMVLAENPSLFMRANSNLPAGTEVSISKLTRSLLTIDALNKTSIYARQAVNVDGKPVNVYFVDSSYEGTRQFLAINFQENLFLFLNAFADNVELIRGRFDYNPAKRPAPHPGFYKRVFAGKSDEDIFMEELRKAAYHELAHSLTTPLIDGGKYRDKHEELLRVVPLPEGSQNYRILQESSAYLAEAAVSGTPQFDLNWLARSGITVLDDENAEAVDYIQVGKILTRMLFDRLGYREFLLNRTVLQESPQDARDRASAEVKGKYEAGFYFLKEQYGLMEEFVLSLDDDAIKSAAKGVYEQYFGELPGFSITIPPEVVKAYKERYSYPNYKPQAPDGAMLAETQGHKTVVEEYFRQRLPAHDFTAVSFDEKMMKQFKTLDTVIKTDVIGALKQGKGVALDLSGIASAENRFHYALRIFGQMAFEVGVAFRFNNPQSMFPTRELLKNALVHGNKLDFSQPIYLDVERREDGTVKAVHVFDLALNKEADKRSMWFAKEAGLHGLNKAVSEYFAGGYGFSYELKPITNAEGNQSGSHAIVYINPDKAMLNVERIFGRLPAAKTFAGFVNELGALSEGSAIAALPGNPRAGHIPMPLSEGGLKFFRDLLNGPDLQPEAHMLTFQDEEGRHLPYGVLLKSAVGGIPYFFDISELFLPGSQERSNYFYALAQESSKALIGGNLATAVQSFSLTRVKTQDKAFELFSIDHRNIFNPTDSASTDYQRAIIEQRGIFQWKDVFETGTGSGVNLLYALKFGAKSAKGSDIYWPHVILSRLNLQYAQETKQVRQVPEGSAHVDFVDHSRGPGELGLADVYLFNTPVITTAEEVSARIGTYKEAFARADSMSKEEFLALFNQLKKKLKENNAAAVWRILPSLSSNLAEIPEEQKKARSLNQMQLIAEAFLKENGFDLASSRTTAPDVFRLESPDQAMLGQKERIAQVREYVIRTGPGKKVTPFVFSAEDLEYENKARFRKKIKDIANALAEEESVALSVAGIDDYSENMEERLTELKRVTQQISFALSGVLDLPFDVERTFPEILDNAFMHGNKFDFALPVFIYLTLSDESRVEEIHVVDLASPKELTEEMRVLARDLEISGEGEGINMIKEEFGFQYRRDVIAAESGQPIGSQVTVAVPDEAMLGEIASPEGKRVAQIINEHTIKVIDKKTGETIKTITSEKYKFDNTNVAFGAGGAVYHLKAYYDILQESQLINLETNEALGVVGITGFFRGHEIWLPQLKNYLENIIPLKISQNDLSLKVVSLASSFGAEPYSLAVVIENILKERGQDPGKWNVQIFAYDINPFAETTAREGKFGKLYKPYNIAESFTRAKYEPADYGRFEGDEFVFAERLRKWIVPKTADVSNQQALEEIKGLQANVMFGNYFLIYLPFKDAFTVSDFIREKSWAQPGYQAFYKYTDGNNESYVSGEFDAVAKTDEAMLGAAKLATFEKNGLKYAVSFANLERFGKGTVEEVEYDENGQVVRRVIAKDNVPDGTVLGVTRIAVTQDGKEKSVRAFPGNQVEKIIIEEVIYPQLAELSKTELARQDMENPTAFGLIDYAWTEAEVPSADPLLKEIRAIIGKAATARGKRWEDANAILPLFDARSNQDYEYIAEIVRGLESKKKETETKSPGKTENVGGIDLNPALLDMQIKRDTNGVPLPLPQQPIQNMHINGFLPVIINITPINNLPMLLGAEDSARTGNELSLAK